MRKQYGQELELLHVELIRMGALCEEAISAAAKALLEGDRELAEAAKAAEREIDDKERAIESLCMKLLLRQQPVAGDLRTVSSALKMISDMERIGDQAEDIAELAGYVNMATAPGRLRIDDMARATISMVTDSVDSFVRRDLALAQAVMAEDDRVDALFADVKRAIIDLISRDNTQGELALDLLMVAKYLERIGDHATNIAEWVAYSITGEHPKTD